MSFPSPNLDDRRFQDLVDEAKRLIPTFLPEWTNHNVSDPGVALIELYAWMTELVLFRLNQVPDRLYASFLDLVGIDPFPASAARVPVTFWFSSVPEAPVVVPARTEVATVGDDPVVFSTEHELVLPQPQLEQVFAAEAGDAGEPDEADLTDLAGDLAVDTEVVRVFPSDPVRAGDALYLGFRERLSGVVLRLDVQADVEGVGIDPSRPPLAWEIWTAEGWVECTVAEDQTGGLNRNGRVVVQVPDGHLPLTVSGVRSHWLRLRLLEPAPGQPGYRTSPAIGRLGVAAIGGTTTAVHAEAVGGEFLGLSDGRPAQEFRLSLRPLLEREEGEHVEIRVDGIADAWIEVRDFSGSGPDDHHVVVDGTSGVVRFGPRIRYPDGTRRQHGAVPPAGAQIWFSGYRVGGGAAGNVGSGTITSLRSAVPFIDRVVNPVPAIGGVDAESIENAKMRAPMTLVSGGRAVTLVDHEQLALQASARVRRARAIAPDAPGGPVRLLLVPDPGRPVDVATIDDFALDDALFETVSEHLESRRLLGAAIEVGAPRYQGVSVAALVVVSTGRAPAAVRQRCIDRIAELLSPVVGGADGQGWPFGTDLTSGLVANELLEVPGVRQVEEVVLFEADPRNGRRIGEGADMIRLEPQTLFIGHRHQVVAR